jgi:hypothetical protein
MRLLGLLISVSILAGVMVYAYRYYFTAKPNTSGLDTSLPAVEQQVEKMQDKVELYDQKMKNYEEIIDQN